MRWLPLLVLVIPTSLLAQERVVVRGDELGSESSVARQAVRVFNDRETTSVFGSFTIDRNDVYEGDVAISNGTLTIRGEVRGDVVAINADVDLRRTAHITGDVLVLGGSLTRADGVRIEGNTRLHRARVAVDRQSDRLTLRSARRRAPRRTVRPSSFARGGATIVLTTGGTYNRVEGLPILAGPRINWVSRNGSGFLVEGLVIARTAGDFDSDDRQDLGYNARAEATFGDRSMLTLGAQAYDRVESIEAWQLPADEVGWGTLLWHRDYRDYYLSRGFAGYLEIRPDERLTIRGSYGQNEETTARARNPWTPFRRDEAWRANAVIDEGTFTSIRGEVIIDSRNEQRSWSSGWYIRAQVEHSTSDDVVQVGLPTTIRSPLPTTTSYQFKTALVDIRRYERIGDGEIRVRAVGAGTLGDDPLPVQRRLSLGGPEPMPGFPFRQFTCAGTTVLASAAALCDRMVLGQIEYRGSLSFSTDRGARGPRRSRRSDKWWEDEDFFDWDWFWVDGPDFVFFANAGTAWLEADGPGDIVADAGAGLEFGSVGIYGAKAITEDGSARLTIRLHRRF